MAADVDKWRERIQRAKKIREMWAEQFKVDMLRDYFEGKQNPGEPTNEWITINKVYSHLMAQLPILYSLDPYFYVKLKKSYSINPSDIALWDQRGTIRQAYLNYLKIELELKDHARLAIQDAHFAYGVLKVRRCSEQKEHEHAGEPMLDDNNKPMMGQDGAPLVYPDTIPVNERYESERVHPDDMLWDEDAGPLQKSWGWLGQHICMSKEDALEDPRFNKRVIKALKGKSRDASQDGTKGGMLDKIVAPFKGENAADLFLDFWEIYDLDNKEWLMYVEGGTDLAVDPKPLPPGVEGHPFAILRFTLNHKSPYPIPPLFNMLDPQKEYNLARSRILTHRKRFNRKYEVVVANIGDNADGEIAKMEAGDDGTCVRVNVPGTFHPIQDAPLDQMNYSELALLNNDMTEMSGTPDNARSVASADSATEASLLDKRLEIREGDRMSMVVDWITNWARKMDQLVQCYIDKDEAVKITGPQGENWQVVRQTDYEQIDGEYEYSVNIGASQPRLPDIERAQLIAFISQVLIPFPHILTSPVLMKRFAELFHIEDEAFVSQLVAIGKQIMSGQMPFPGQQGGGPSDNPVAKLMGAALGPQGGNTNGGGAPGGMMNMTRQ